MKRNIGIRSVIIPGIVLAGYIVIALTQKSFSFGEAVVIAILLTAGIFFSAPRKAPEGSRKNETNKEIIDLQEKVKLLESKLNSQSLEIKESRKRELQIQMQNENIQGIDQISGLFNHTAAHIFLNKAAKHAKRHGLDFGLMYLGLNHIEEWEDPQSHVKEFADYITHTIRESDLAFYMYEGEFLLILEGCGFEGGDFLLKRIDNNLINKEHLDFSYGLSILTDSNSEIMYSLLEDAKMLMHNRRDALNQQS